MSNDFVPSRGRKRCPSCGKGVGVRSKVCKYCLYKFESKVLPQHLRAVADFVAACGGFVQARVALRESEAFLDQVAEFNRKYLKRDHNEVLESEVVSDDIGIIGSNRGCGVG